VRAIAQQVARGVVLPADDLVGCVVAVLLHELPILPQSGAVADQVVGGGDEAGGGGEGMLC
jgi:hypothetical protein